jgi:hypothetical protein
VRPRSSALSSIALFMAAAIGLLACSTPPALLSVRASDGAKRLGAAEGSACGSMLIGPSGYNFLPVQLTSRYERAYQSALASVPSATALTGVTVSEYWFF